MSWWEDPRLNLSAEVQAELERFRAFQRPESATGCRCSQTEGGVRAVECAMVPQCLSIQARLAVARRLDIDAARVLRDSAAPTHWKQIRRDPEEQNERFMVAEFERALKKGR